MPRLQTYDQRVPVSGPLPEIPRRLNVAGVLGEALDHVDQNVELVRQRDDAVSASRILSDLRLKTTKRLIDAQNTAADDAAEFTPGVLHGFSSDLEEAKQSTQSQRVRSLVHEQSLAIREDLAQNAMRFEASRRMQSRADTLRKSADTLRTTLELDPDQYGTATVEQDTAIDAMQLEPNARREAREYLIHSALEGAATGIAKRDPRLALANLSTAKSGDPRFDALPPEMRQRVEQRARIELVNQTTAGVVGAFQRSTASGVRALAGLDKAGIPAELLDDIKAHVGQGVSQLRALRRQERAGDLERVERAITTDTAGLETEQIVDSLYSSGALGPEERANTLGRIDASNIQRAKSNAGALEVARALAAGLPLDPQDPDHKKGLTSLFDASTKGVAPGSEPWLAAAQAVATRTRMLPEPAISWTRSALRSPDPKLAATAAQFAGAVGVNVPDALSTLDDKSRSFAAQVNGMIEVGTNPAKAVEVARENVFNVPEPVLEARKKAWGNAGKSSLVGTSSSTLANLIDRDFDPGWLSSQPVATDARASRVADARRLEPDFRELTEKYFLNSGDIDQARELAWSDIKRVYGPSNINGTSQMMAFPPERAGITREEVESGAAEILKANPQADGTTPADVTLVPDALTLRNVGDALAGRMFRPSYAVIGKSGEPLLDQNGQRIRFEIPSGEEISKRIRAAEAQAEATAAAQVEEARRKRESLRRARETFPAYEGY